MSTSRPTMEDVARHAGVSRALVSIVFREVPGASEQTRERVLRAAAGLGYVPDRRASRLGRSRTRMVGVVFSLRGDFHAEVIDAMYVAADSLGYEVVLSGTTARRSESSAVRAVLAERCEGVALIGPQLATRDIAQLAARVPTVVLLRPLRVRTVDAVRTDERIGMSELVEHLAGLGHQRIVHVDGGTAPGAAERRRAYRTAMTRHGLTPDTTAGGLTEEAGVAAADRLLRGAPGRGPTAIAAFNDRCALGVLHRAISGGLRIPEDLSLTGFDDIGAAGAAHIRLTTVRQDADQLGRFAIERLRDRLEDARPPAPPCLVPPSLVIRHTTGRPGSHL